MLCLRRKTAITLIELVVATVIFGIIVSATIAGTMFLQRLHVEKKAYEPAMAGARALDYFFVRMLRSGKAEVLDASGRSGVSAGPILEFSVAEEGGETRRSRFIFDAQKEALLYDYEFTPQRDDAEVVAKGIKSAVFRKDFEDRISVELEVSTEDIFQTALKALPAGAGKEALAVEVSPKTIKLRTSVRGRNIPTPKGIIN